MIFNNKKLLKQGKKKNLSTLWLLVFYLDKAKKILYANLATIHQ